MNSTDKRMVITGFICAVAYLPLGIALAVLVPDDILNNPMAKIFTEFMSLIVPRVRETGLLTTVPATQCIIAVMTFIAFIATVLIFIPLMKRAYIDPKIFIIEDELRVKPIRAFLKWYVIIPAFSVGGSLILFFSTYSTFKELVALNSKLGMGTYISFLMLCTFIMFAAGIRILKVLYILAKRKM